MDNYEIGLKELVIKNLTLSMDIMDKITEIIDDKSGNKIPNLTHLGNILRITYDFIEKTDNFSSLEVDTKNDF